MVILLPSCDSEGHSKVRRTLGDRGHGRKQSEATAQTRSCVLFAATGASIGYRLGEGSAEMLEPGAGSLEEASIV